MPEVTASVYSIKFDINTPNKLYRLYGRLSQMSNEFYVYLLLDPRKFYLPFYVGKGKGNRCNDHLQSKLKNDKNKFKKNIISAIRTVELEPKVMIWENGLNEQEAYVMEIELIKKFGRRDNNTGILTNLTDGGEGLSGHQFSDEHRRKISEANRNRIISEETREKHRVIAQNRPPISDETREKLIRAAYKRKETGWIHPSKGIPLSEERKEYNRKWMRTNQPNKGKRGRAGIENLMFGKTHSSDVKQKISIANSGKPMPKGNDCKYSDKTIYKFQNQDGTVFTGTKFDLCDRYSLRVDQISQMISGKAKTYKGWYI
jgi:hypothetical protein